MLEGGLRVLPADFQDDEVLLVGDAALVEEFHKVAVGHVKRNEFDVNGAENAFLDLLFGVEGKIAQQVLLLLVLLQRRWR